jgi:hypothetical protein
VKYFYVAGAILFLGVLIGTIKWIGRSFGANLGTKASRETADMFLARMMREHAAKAGRSAGAGESPLGTARPTTAALVVYCPACGTALNSAPNSLPFAADCAGCGRHVKVRGDGPGRISIMAIEANR